MGTEARLIEILGDWQERRERGEYVPPEDVIRANPDLAVELRARFAALDVVERTYAESARDGTEGPRRIGEFEILGELGRGGMGVVYVAHQPSMERRVALKVLFPSITTRERAVERFQREAQIAGRLQHTNIVPVYSMGRDGGVWFYAMELVEGSSLDSVLDAMRDLGDDPGYEHSRLLSGSSADGAPEPTPSIRQRGEAASSLRTGDRGYYLRVARMFAAVADALQIAHEARVIHRDVKPSNLILDSAGCLKLVDFGLARVLDQVPPVTRSGERVGTPVYMSPEQARARSDEIDHRTDIYSLGATLYEVLTLRPPFGGDALGDVYASIMTKEPTRPRRANPRVPRDLETVVQKAMEKDPARRYAAAASMAWDLRAFSEGATIRARRIGPLEGAWRRIKRNKPLAVTATAALLLLLFGSTFFLVRLGAAHREASEKRRVADDMAAFLLFEFKDKLQEVGKLELLADAARKALAYYEQLPAEELTLEDRARRSIALQNIGEILAKGGERAAARQAFERRIRLLEDIVARAPDDDDWRTNLLMSHLQLATVLPADEARQTMETTLRESERMARGKPDAARWQWAHARVLTEFSLRLFYDREHQRAFDMSAEAVNILEALHEADPGNAVVNGDLEHARQMRRHHLSLAGRVSEEVLAWWGEELERQERQAGKDPDNHRLKNDVAGLHYNLAIDLGKSGLYERMLVHARGAVVRFSFLRERDPDNPSYLDMLAFSHEAVAMALTSLGRRAEALAPRTACLHIREQQGKHHRVANVCAGLAAWYEAASDRAEALRWRRRAEEAYARGRDPMAPPNRTARKHRAARLAVEGDSEGALREWQAVLADLQREAESSQTPRLADEAGAHAAIGTHLRDLDRPDEAADAFRSALLLRERHAETCRGNAQWQMAVVSTCLDLGELLATGTAEEREEATVVLERGLAICRRLEGEGRSLHELQRRIPRIEKAQRALRER